MQHREQLVAILLQLGALVAVARVLHRQLVQAELALHLQQVLLGGVAQRHPDKAAGPGQVVVDLALGDVGELAAVLVGDAVDEHARMIPAATRWRWMAAGGRNRDRRYRYNTGPPAHL